VSANLEVVAEEEGVLFQAKPYIRRKVGVDFTSDKNKGISEIEAAELERIEGTDELVEFRVFVNVKGYKKVGDAMTYFLNVTDCTMDLT
jgi:hypothetical protein